MGYAIVLPYSLLKIASSQPAGSSVELTTAQTNFSIASFTTPAYSGNPALAFVDIIVPSRQNWDATQSNFFDATNLGYIGIDSGGGTKDCGKIPQYAFHTPAKTVDMIMGYWCGEYRVKGTTNVAQWILPNTTYACKIMKGQSHSDSLFLYNTYFELQLYFNI